MEGHYDVALICKNGHVINSSSIEYPHNNTKYCHECGRPYPWTEEKIKVLEETIDLMDKLTDLEKEEFKKDVLDISNDSPRTSLAALKIKKMRTKIGKEIWVVAKEILFQIGTETALKGMNLK